MNLPFFTRRPRPLTASDLGRLGGRASAEARRKPIRERTRWLREQMGLAPDWRLS